MEEFVKEIVLESSRSLLVRKPKRLLIRLLVGTVGLLCVGLLAVGWHLAHDDPTVAIPNPAMPNPNAFDYYVAASSGVVGANTFLDIGVSRPKVPMTLEQGEAVIKRNAGALRTLHQGFEYEYRNPPDMMDAIAAQARRPYASKLSPPPVPEDPINQVIFPTISNTRFREVQTHAQNGLLLVALALHAYKLEKGRYPAALTELAPSYLKKVLEDPFALQGGFRYRSEVTRYVLYSVGPDGTDEGGRPIDDPNAADPARPRARHQVQLESRGDIVAGVNTP